MMLRATLFLSFCFLDEEFSGETFLLLEEDHIAELNISMVDKMRELLIEVRMYVGHVEHPNML